MASIRCPVCGKEVSPFTRIHCGRPLPAVQSAPENPQTVKQVDVESKTYISNSSTSHAAPSSVYDRMNNAIIALRFDPNKRARFVKVLMAVLVLCIAVLAVIGLSRDSDKEFAKSLVKEEVLKTWQRVDEEFKLIGITFDSVKVDELNNYEKQVYLDEHSDIGFTDADGTHYKNVQAYYKAIGYDVNENTWRRYTVKGTYHVNNGKGEDYEGYYTVRVTETKHWGIEKTEIELPTELQP